MKKSNKIRCILHGVTNSAGKILLIFLFLSGFAGKSDGQVLQDQEVFDKIKKGVVCIYNFQFEEASEISDYIGKKCGNCALSYLFKGMETYWRSFPLTPGSKDAEIFENYLEKAISLSEAKLKVNGSDAENLLSGLGSAGLLLMFYADNGLSGKVLSLAPKTYQWVMKSFDYTKTYKDFYFITGLYNYYREAYATAHPIYKPALIFFPHGNKKAGLAQLKISADSSIFLAAESMTFLAGIYQDFEKDPAKAIIYSKRLKETFPKNHEYKIQYIRDLLVIKKFGEAESLLNGMPYESLNKFYQAQIDVFKGVVQEQKYKNPKAAEQLYWSGINKAEAYGPMGAEYASYGYFGLSRINAAAGNNKNAKQYHKKARELSTYDHVNFD
jgi:hypothetical protein